MSDFTNGSSKHAFFFLTIFGLLFLGKYHFLLGFEGHLNPIAPVWAILLKDFLFGVLHLYFLFYYVKSWRNFTETQQKFLLKGVMFITLLFLLSLPHLYSKSIREWGQHYVRNIYYYLPIVLYTFSTISTKVLGKKFFELVWALSILNFIMGIIQLVWMRDTLLEYRPLGFSSGPNILAMVFVAGLYISMAFHTNLRFYISSFVLAVGLELSASLSTSIVFGISLVLLLLLSFKLDSLKGADRNLRLRLFTLILLVIFISLGMYALSPQYYTFRRFLKYSTAVLKNEPSDVYSVKGRLISVNVGKEFLEKLPVQNKKNTDVDLHDFTFTTIVKKSLLLLLGNFYYKRYYRLDIVFSSLVTNFGLVGLISYLIMMSYLGYFSFMALRQPGFTGSIGLICFGYFIVFFLNGFFHSVTYKYPANLLIYVLFGILARLKTAKVI